MAERGGFEPPVELLTLQRFSKPPPSATRPSLLLIGDYTGSCKEEAETPGLVLPDGRRRRQQEGLPATLSQPVSSGAAAFPSAIRASNPPLRPLPDRIQLKDRQ